MPPKTNTSREDFTIRIRFRLPSKRLGIEEPEITAGVASNGNEIKLKSADLTSPIKDADWLILVSDGWKTEESAKTESNQLVDSLCRALSFHNLGADLGRRTPGGGGFFRAFLDKLEEQSGHTILNDERGVMIFQTKLHPYVARAGEVSFCITVPGDKWTSTFQNAVNLGESFTQRESMAFDLFSMAHKTQQSADARFVLLFAALETLLEPTSRPKPSQDHVNDLISRTEIADLSEEEKESLVSSLRWLRNYSIRASGQEFVRIRLGDHKYGELTAEELFLECYKLRNRLLHGQLPFADWGEVSNVVGSLEQMVSHILSGNLQSN